ncbi:pyrroloquinoline quinone precursor peptide PqqA [Allokutzneria oryzae]|uniref:Coenzyme PQQ synthesis protein A n=1 Tax=Allokutzneria oryzae TaxID=1378989 RepID=A0ABV6A245_9PSEU
MFVTTTTGRRATGVAVESTERPEWVVPDFAEYDTPMEVTAYAARS